jgi:hypothetical protein
MVGRQLALSPTPVANGLVAPKMDKRAHANSGHLAQDRLFALGHPDRGIRIRNPHGGETETKGRSQ